MLALGAARIGNSRVAQIGPASICASACSTVTPHSASPLRIAQSSADGPRSPTMPGCTMSVRCRRQIDSGTARLRKGATITSGANSATASSATESAMSNSTETSCPSSRNSANRRWVRLLKLWVSSRMRMSQPSNRRWRVETRPTSDGGDPVGRVSTRHSNGTRSGWRISKSSAIARPTANRPCACRQSWCGSARSDSGRPSPRRCVPPRAPADDPAVPPARPRRRRPGR